LNLNAYALQYASKRLKNKKNVVVVALKQDGPAAQARYARYATAE
jgi:hypothetical protein